MIKVAVCEKCKSLFSIGKDWSRCGCGNVEVRLDTSKPFPNSFNIIDFPLEMKVKEKNFFACVNINGITDLLWNAAQFPVGVRQISISKSEKNFSIPINFILKDNLKEIIFQQPYMNIPTNTLLYYKYSEGVFVFFGEEGAKDLYKINGYTLNKMYNRKEVISFLDINLNIN